MADPNQGKANPTIALPLERQMALRLFRNEHVHAETGPASNTLLVTVTLKYRSPWLARLFRPRRERSYLLEGVGLEVYLACDGVTTLGMLVEQWRRDYQLSFFEARGLLINYLHVLIARGLVVMAATPPETPPPEPSP